MTSDGTWVFLLEPTAFDLKISPTRLRQLWTPRAPCPPRTAYGLGLSIQFDYHGVTLVRHGGGLEGVSSHLGFVPEREHGVAVLPNLGDKPVSCPWSTPLWGSSWKRHLTCPPFIWMLSTSLQIYSRVILLLSGPALSALAIFAFLAQWNSFLYPLVVTNSTEMSTLTVGLRTLQGQYNMAWTLLMAGSVIALVPVLPVFISVQRYFIKGIAMTGLGGR